MRAGANGLGGRPLQILAVLLTYFAITTSYIPVFFYQIAKDPQKIEEAKQRAAARKAAKDGTSVADAETPKPPMGLLGAILFLLLMFAFAPFFGLTTGISGLISLFIIFIGLKQAWTLTGRTELLVMGPYETAPAQ